MSTSYTLPYLPITTYSVEQLFSVYGKACRSLARLDGMLSERSYANVLLSPMMTQEAVLSSRIEGTRSTIDEVYSMEAGEESTEAQRLDVQEILNYREAMRYATESLSHRGLTLGLIREMHAILLKSVRGQNKCPGQVRDTQNWIGALGSNIEQATYVPPPPTAVDAYLDNWIENASADGVEPLLQAGILHAQFELIHPFHDGNGRVGRLLIPLYLHSKGLLERPVFYLSEYFEKHRDQYIDCLNDLHRDNTAWNPWLLFFLNAVDEQARENMRRAAAMQRLYKELQRDLPGITNSAACGMLLDAMFETPIFSRSQISARIRTVNTATVQRMIHSLVDAQILHVRTRSAGRRAATYQLRELLLIVQGLPISRFDY